MPVTVGSIEGDFEITRIEIEYLGGIDRLDDPAPVKMVIGPAGIEVNEILPGSRSVKIAAEQIVAVEVEDASTFVEAERKRSDWFWFLIRPLGSASPRQKALETKRHDYLLRVQYREDGEIRNAVFRREDPMGLSLLDGLARIITLLIRRNELNVDSRE